MIRYAAKEDINKTRSMMEQVKEAFPDVRGYHCPPVQQSFGFHVLREQDEDYRMVLALQE